MASYIDTWTDKELAKMEKHIAEIYKQAAEELEVTASEYFEQFQERYLEQYAAYQAGEYTKEEFDAWLQAQVGRGKRWEKMRDDMATRMTNANKIAADYMDDSYKAIFAENYNYAAYTVEQAVKQDPTYASVDFTLLNENTVKRLVKNKELTMLPKPRIQIPKDQEWNKQKLQNALLQSILQGESIDKMANRISTSVGHMNQVSAVRNARTMCTEAQNAGRQMNYDEAQELGIEMEKEWMSAHDDRTRESHVQLDGVRVKPGDKFPNGLEYPGDHRGAPAEVYNCRCTMRSVFPKYASGQNRRTENTVESYKAWKQSKEFNIGDYVDDDLIDFSGLLKSKSFTPLGNKSKIRANKVPNSKSGMYSTLEVKISDEEMDEIDEYITSSLEITGAAESENRPDIVLAHAKELKMNNNNLRFGTYDPVTNTVYISVESFNRPNNPEYLMPDDKRRTTVHELMHWETAELYRKEHGKITRKNYHDYKKFAEKVGKQIVRENPDVDFRMLSKNCEEAIYKDPVNYNEIGTDAKTYEILKKAAKQ